ncbi:hypothetical protein OG471_00805 [Streptomyces sp. NBC_01336]|uniref:hypothetical protein n=1 Tax=Streptomyces sp. NBC_01336 TaxID=2903829 RepID=UPI002E0F9F47|nr:hypothetical protein OG471_00805 [Streptomyces sp. NBC_01336]
MSQQDIARYQLPPDENRRIFASDIVPDLPRRTRPPPSSCSGSRVQARPGWPSSSPKR